MKYSISESARIVGVTRKTLYKHIEKKPITVEKDDNQNPVVDASELIRVYGDQCRFDREKDTEESRDGEQEETRLSSPVPNLDTALAVKELELLRAQIEQERKGYEEQIDYLRGKLDEAHSESRKMTALLTSRDQEKEERDQEWKKEIRALDSRVANQEQQMKKERAVARKYRQHALTFKKALEEETSKSLWQKMFG